MNKSIILDFAGIIADIDYINLVGDAPLKHKYSALRIFLSWRKNYNIKNAFAHYQKGLIDVEELEEFVRQYCPKSSYVIKSLLERFHKYVKVNHDVLNLVSILRSHGIKMFFMSNTIPETEAVIKGLKFDEIFDGLALSTEIGTKKPLPDIYQYIVETYDLNPKETLMIDDTKKNLVTAEKFGMKTIHCKNSKETYKVLLDLLHKLDLNQYNQ